MKMSWSPEEDLQFEVFSKKGQQLKYVQQDSIHTPGTIRVIPSRFLNRLAKITLRNPPINSEVVDKISPNHANTLSKAGLTPPNFPKMRDLWRKHDENVDMEKERDVSKNKKINVYFCVTYSRCFFYIYRQGDQQA